MKMPIFLALMLVFAFALVGTASAININSCTLNSPPSPNNYDDGVITFNATVVYSNVTGSSQGSNITNVTFTVGTVIYSNSTANGTRTNNSASADGNVFASDFTFSIASGTLSDASRTTYATCWNSTDATIASNSLNSSTTTYVIDTKNPSVVVSIPLAGSIVVPANSQVTFEYTPTELNLGNCTLHLNNQAVKSSTSATTTPNATSGTINRFTHTFASSNNSIRAVVSCIDLAGLSGTGNNFTFGVITGSSPYAVKQRLQESGGGGFAALQPSSSQGFSGVSQSPSVVEAKTHLQKYLWIYVIIIIGLILLGFRKRIFR